MGMWNGVGGTIEANETPLQCVLREIKEETDLDITDVVDKGCVTFWFRNEEGVGVPFSGGMQLYSAELPGFFYYPIPKGTSEGVLDFKEISWVLDPQNGGVVSNIKHYLPVLMSSEKRHEFRCFYSSHDNKHGRYWQLTDVEVIEL
jgi:8-oxo-dGTP diphosphatase